MGSLDGSSGGTGKHVGLKEREIWAAPQVLLSSFCDGGFLDDEGGASTMGETREALTSGDFGSVAILKKLAECQLEVLVEAQ